MPTLNNEIDNLKSNLEKRSFAGIRTMLRGLDAADIAHQFKSLAVSESIVLFRLIDRARRAEVFAFLELDQQESLLEELPDVVVISVLDAMEPVDRTRLLESLDPEISNRIILKLSPEERQMAWQLLSYPEDSVGRMMTPEFLSLRSSITVSQAIEDIRWNASNFSKDMILHLFVVDENGKYVGDISLAALFVADPTSQAILEIMDPPTGILNAFDDQELAVDAFRKYDEPIIPVLDERGVLIGVVHADEVFDAAEEEASEDIQQFGGSEALEDSYFQTSIPTLLKKRAGWLAILFAASTLTSETLKAYEHTLEVMSFLILFLPLIVSSGGNSGSQASALIIRGIAVREMELGDWHKVFRREITVGLGLGLILGTLGYFWSIIWGMEQYIAVIVATSLLCVVIFGAVVGSMLPFLLKRLGLDPAVCSSPLIASVSDVVGILIFFNIAIKVASLW